MNNGASISQALNIRFASDQCLTALHQNFTSVSPSQNCQFQEDFRRQTSRYREEITKVTKSFEEAVNSLETALEEAFIREQDAERNLKQKLDKAYQFGLECAQIRSEAKFNEILEKERKKLERSYDEQLSKILCQDESVIVSTHGGTSNDMQNDILRLFKNIPV